MREASQTHAEGMSSRVWIAGLVAISIAGAAQAQENDATRCRNGLDDDGDGRADCGDPDCGLYVFCAQQAPQYPQQPMYPGYPQTGYMQPGPVVGTHPNWVLVGIGFPLFAVAWIADMSVTAAVSRYEESILFSILPVAGPFIQIGFAS